MNVCIFQKKYFNSRYFGCLPAQGSFPNRCPLTQSPRGPWLKATCESLSLKCTYGCSPFTDSYGNQATGQVWYPPLWIPNICIFPPFSSTRFRSCFLKKVASLVVIPETCMFSIVSVFILVPPSHAPTASPTRLGPAMRATTPESATGSTGRTSPPGRPPPTGTTTTRGLSRSKNAIAMMYGMKFSLFLIEIFIDEYAVYFYIFHTYIRFAYTRLCMFPFESPFDCVFCRYSMSNFSSLLNLKLVCIFVYFKGISLGSTLFVWFDLQSSNPKMKNG